MVISCLPARYPWLKFITRAAVLNHFSKVSSHTVCQAFAIWTFFHTCIWDCGCRLHICTVPCSLWVVFSTMRVTDTAHVWLTISMEAFGSSCCHWLQQDELYHVISHTTSSCWCEINTVTYWRSLAYSHSVKSWLYSHPEARIQCLMRSMTLFGKYGQPYCFGRKRKPFKPCKLFFEADEESWRDWELIWEDHNVKARHMSFWLPIEFYSIQSRFFPPVLHKLPQLLRVRSSFSGQLPPAVSLFWSIWWLKMDSFLSLSGTNMACFTAREHIDFQKRRHDSTTIYFHQHTSKQ